MKITSNPQSDELSTQASEGSKATTRTQQQSLDSRTVHSGGEYYLRPETESAGLNTIGDIPAPAP